MLTLLDRTALHYKYTRVTKQTLINEKIHTIIIYKVADCDRCEAYTTLNHYEKMKC